MQLGDALGPLSLVVRIRHSIHYDCSDTIPVHLLLVSIAARLLFPVL